MRPGRRSLAAAAASLLLTIGGLLALRRFVRSLDLDETGPEAVVKKDLATLRLAVWEYFEVNKRHPARLEDALMSLPSRPMRELPRSAKWGYRPEDGHVFVDSTHTDSRGNAWNAY